MAIPDMMIPTTRKNQIDKDGIMGNQKIPKSFSSLSKSLANINLLSRNISVHNAPIEEERVKKVTPITSRKVSVAVLPHILDISIIKVQTSANNAAVIAAFL